MSLTERMSAIRSDYARRGEDVSSLADADILLKELDEANALVNKLTRRDEERRASDIDRERAIRTAARRVYEDRLASWDGLIFHSLTQMSGETVRAALYRAANLSSLASGDTTADVREAAAVALSLWEREVRYLRDGAGRHAGVWVSDQQRTEIGRLRKLITEHAVSISDHKRQRGSLEVCTCTGCSLIRSMDDTGDTLPVSA